jgi:orotidine-5'-phosphate decarboxylase
MYTMHGLGGLEMMKVAHQSATDRARELGMPVPKSLGITVLTSMSEEMMIRTGIEVSLEHQVRSMARLAMEAGLDGVVASPLEITMLRDEIGNSPLIVTPGIRPPGFETYDQSRVATPTEAFEAGANYIVVGRPVTSAPDPAMAFQTLFEQ